MLPHPLYWNDPDQIRALRPPCDLVIAADVVYMEDSAARLVTALEALVGGDGAVLLGYQLRSPDAHQVFWELCRQAFPVTEKVPHEDLHPDYAYEETDGYILRKRKEIDNHKRVGDLIRSGFSYRHNHNSVVWEPKMQHQQHLRYSL